MEKITLNAKERTDLGKSSSNYLRKAGEVPGVVYKDGKQGINVQIVSRDLWHALHTEAGENAVITMNIGDGDKRVEKTVILQEAQRDPLNDKFLHVDFHEISLTDKIKVKIPVVVKGEAPGVFEDKGILTQVIWELEVECLPTEIPEHIDVYVNELHIGDAIHVKDLTIADSVELMVDGEQVVVSVSVPKAEEVEEPEEVAETEEEPEVIKKGKKDEEETPGDEKAPGAESTEDKEKA